MKWEGYSLRADEAEPGLREAAWKEGILLFADNCLARACIGCGLEVLRLGD